MRTTSGGSLRGMVLADLAVLEAALADVQRHTRECSACGSHDHDSKECVEWLRDRWASVTELVSDLRIETASLARGETLTMDREEVEA